MICSCACHTGPYAACSVPGGCGSTGCGRTERTTRRPSHVLEDLAFVAEHWPDLVETRIPGTARPWQPPQVTAERREQLEREARIERLERAEQAPGETPMPVHPDVLDVMVDVVEAADRLGEQVWNAAGRPEPPGPWRLARFFAANPARHWAPASSAYADPRAHLAVIDDVLRYGGALAGSPSGDELADQVAVEFRSLAQQVAVALRLLRDGQVLDGACPWCRMQRALTVRDTPAGLLIVCQSPVACEPPERDYGKLLRGRPAWPQYEWDWLANRIKHADEHAPAGRAVTDAAWAAGADRRAYESAQRARWQKAV